MDGLDDKLGTITILDIGGVHLGTDQQTASIGHNVTLTAFNPHSSDDAAISSASEAVLV